MSTTPGRFTPDPGRPEYWESFFDVVPFPIYVVDAKSLQLINVNRAMREYTGAQRGEICHRAIYKLDAPCLFCPLADLLSRPHPIGESVVFEHFNDIDDRWYQLQETLMSWFDGRTVKYSIAVDISTLKEAQNALAEAHATLALKNRELEKLTITDALTRLRNRRYLDETLRQEAYRADRYGNPLSVVLVDIDRFKSVNDSHGHLVGDQVLVEVANVLRNSVRRTDAVGRWGGEEFMVVCPDTELADAARMAGKLRAAIASHQMPVIGTASCSFGVAQYRNASLDECIRQADGALYRAKESGRNRVEIAQ